MAASDSSILFTNSHLTWRPAIIGRDGSKLGVCEFSVPESHQEVNEVVNQFLHKIEMNGGDSEATLDKKLDDLRVQATRLSDLLRQSRSMHEAAENGAQLKQLMTLFRALEAHYRIVTPKRT